MGGINSLSGLNKVNVDFKPTVELIAPNQDKHAADNLDKVKGAILPSAEKTNAKNVVQKLDVLLLNAARKSVGSDVVAKVSTIGQMLVEKSVITEEELNNLKELAKNAAEKLNELDTISPRALATAMTKKTEAVADWSKATEQQLLDKNFTPKETIKKEVIDWNGGLGGLTPAAEMVTKAIDAQFNLSAALGEFNEKLAKCDAVDANLQDLFTELQFQCDRRASEIDSIVTKMYGLVEQSKKPGNVMDPKSAELFKASFMDLMAREAITSHGTAGDFEIINQKFTEKFRPLAEKLDEFSKDGSKILTKDEIKSLQDDMEAMKEAVINVRDQGLDERTVKIQKGILWWKKTTTYKIRTEVDRSILEEMNNILTMAENQLNNMKAISLQRSVDSFLKDVENSLSPENAPRYDKDNQRGNDVIEDVKSARECFMKALKDFASDKIDLKTFDKEIATCKGMTDEVLQWHKDIEDDLEECGVDRETSTNFVKAFCRITLIAEQLKELKRLVKEQEANNSDFGIATSDVRRIMLGDVGLSNVVEAKIRGFKPSDANTVADESNIVSSKPLGAGNAGKTYLLTTKTGGEIVFKPELDSRLGLDTLVFGEDEAYDTKQTTANLNLATQDTAKALGCQDLVVKYSVGNHNGQFGFFMEKAKGFTGYDFAEAEKNKGDGVTPKDINNQIRYPKDQCKVQGQIAKKLNKLMWLDLITGQGDRHGDNYFVHIDRVTHDVTVNAIDNDASFTTFKTGIQKFTLDPDKALRFADKLKNVCNRIHKGSADAEYNNRVLKDPSIHLDSKTGILTVDLSKSKSPEVNMAILETFGMQSIGIPEEIDKEFYEALMKLKSGTAEREAFLNSLKPRLSQAALKATEGRLDDAIAHAEQLKKKGKVYDNKQWQDSSILQKMRTTKSEVDIKKSDGTTLTLRKGKSKMARELCERGCPSIYTRDNFGLLFS